MHDVVIVIHIKYKFHEIPFSGYLVMATEGWTDGHGQNYIPPPSAGVNKAQFLRTYVISLYHMLSLYEVKPFIWTLRRTDHEIIFRSVLISTFI